MIIHPVAFMKMRYVLWYSTNKIIYATEILCLVKLSLSSIKWNWKLKNIRIKRTKYSYICLKRLKNIKIKQSCQHRKRKTSVPILSSTSDTVWMLFFFISVNLFSSRMYVCILLSCVKYLVIIKINLQCHTHVLFSLRFCHPLYIRLVNIALIHWTIRYSP